MVKRSELETKIKEKILLTGGTGVGKTHTAVKIAEFVAEHGRRVVFIDTEYGAERELELLSDEVLENIELRVTPSWEMLKGAVFSNDDCFLKIVDGLSAVFELNKAFVEDRFVARGRYMVGEKEIEITDRAVFTLPWQSYPKVYDSVRSVCRELVEQKPHIICTHHPFGESETKMRLTEDIARKFDTILELRRTPVTQPKPAIRYEAVLRKHRGRGFSAFVVFEGYIEQLKKLFGRRLGLGEAIST